MRRGVSPPALDPTDDIERQRIAAAERQRRWKDRQIRGEIVLHVPIDHEFVALLLDAGEIDEDASRDRRKLAAVVLRLASAALGNALPTRRRD